MKNYSFQQGKIPLLVSMPHVGIDLPEAILPRMTAQARILSDTDWHLEQLYSFLDELNPSLIIAQHSRYVIDLNRPPDNRSLYPGTATTGLCPTELFEGSPIYLLGETPHSQEIIQRTQDYWQPYHEQIRAELERLKAAYGIAVLWDAHSIRSQIPRLFQGRLPDLNLGTFSGKSADAQLAERLLTVAKKDPNYTAVLNGRFQGGYITRHYGCPEENVHAVQLELVQATYMQEEPPFNYLAEKAIAIRPVLRDMIETVIQWISESSLLNDSGLSIND